MYPSRSSSSSSAVDLTGTPTGLRTSVPPSPSLTPSDSQDLASSSFSRRRTSWGRAEVGSNLALGQDPLQLDTSHPPPLTRPSFTDDDPFSDSPTDEALEFFARRPRDMSHDDSSNHAYTTSQAAPSTASLITLDMDNHDRRGSVGSTGGLVDPELSASSRRQHRLSTRYTPSPSPLKGAGSALQAMKKSMRRVSLRVVNFGGAGLGDHARIRLTDEDEKDGGETDAREIEEESDEGLSTLPLRGRTLGVMGPDNPLRRAFYRLLVYPWTEPTILLLIIINAVVLTIQAADSLTLDDPDAPPQPVKGYFKSWEDYALFVLFALYTLEAFARICVSGLLFDPEIPSVPSDIDLTSTSTYPPPAYPLPPVAEKMLSTADGAQKNMRDTGFLGNVLRSDRPRPETLSLPFKLSIQHARGKTDRNIPYLRHSWSRIDAVAIVSFWISFWLATGGAERGAGNHIEVFRAMSVIRTARLLTITSGTTTIMHSLKTARPLLASVAYFVLFAMVLFSIIGIQSFKGSLRRTCFVQATDTPSTLGVIIAEEIQLEGRFCGAFIDPTTLERVPYLLLNGENAPAPKGYTCPLGQVCKEDQNPESGVQGFDTIYMAALQVLIVASANGWSPLMYAMADSEFFISCFFFIVCIIVLNFWLINLFVAVITNTFSAIRKETSKSAFGAAPYVSFSNFYEGWSDNGGRRPPKKNPAKVIYDYIQHTWTLLALVSLVIQGTRTVDVSATHTMIIDYAELVITIAFDVEIVLRLLASLPDWRRFFTNGRNLLDLTLAIASSIIQIPVIHDSDVYPWFTIFQLARFYRVILIFPRMKPLLLAVFGNMYGLGNMTLFLLMVNYLAALVAVQLLRGDYSADEAINFGEIYNAFLGVYQVFSSEDWQSILYGATSVEGGLGQTVIVAIFFAGWLLFSNFIMLQMFIAVINENFDVAEEAKRGKQASNYWANHHSTQDAGVAWIHKFNPYRLFKANPVKVKVENLPSNLVLPMQKALVQDYSLPKTEGSNLGSLHGARHYTSKSLSALQRLFAGDVRSNDVPLTTFRHDRAGTLASVDPQDDEIERHLELLAAVNQETTAEQLHDAKEEVLMQKADFIRDHPSFDKPFWIFSQKNLLRRGCQKLVQPAGGKRIFGSPPSAVAYPVFQTLLLCAVIGGIVVESIATPLYRRQFYVENGLKRGAWFDLAEAAFGFTLFVEFVIKVIADGFLFTPNAYIRSIWNILDFTIMIGLLVNVTTTLIFIGGLSRFTRSLKALRALRLITLFEISRDTFQSLILSGASRIMDAAILAILYMIPYAVWGLNIFAGQMNMCNDGDATGISDCIGEFTNNALDDNSLGFPVPRVWDNPSPSTTFSFDTFSSSLLILFEVVSLEGWIDVMVTAMGVTGRGQQPQTNASQINAIFFLIYNLLGGVVILTLFVSIIIGNFSSKTGAAFLTKPQREWIDLKKLLTRQKPSKRPRTRPTWSFRAWCYDRAVQKHGWWSRSMTVLFFLHIVVLIRHIPRPVKCVLFPLSLSDSFVDMFALAVTFIYVIDTVVRCFGLGWRSFRANGWNLFDIVVAWGCFTTTLIVRFQPDTASFAVQQLDKLFLVSIAFKLVQRSDSLNKLFKTAMASLRVILSLLGLWFILFLFFAILFLEVFSLTKWNSSEDRNQNFSSMGGALVMLAFMSTGEAWNQYMHDYSLVYPRCTIAAEEDDCGSQGWAFSLFIAWNLLSMYIFLNLFTGVVVESFSYVYQTSKGGAKSVTRQEMRAFKKVWAEFANEKTGYLERNRFVPFFAKLRGVFEVKIYPEEYNIRNIVAACRESPDGTVWPPRVCDGIDLHKLEGLLNTIDYGAIRRRRAIYCRLYHETTISHHQGRGISFTEMLLLLAHHKLIVDRDALVLKDLVVRTETNKLVSDLVNLDRVRSLLRSITARRRFLAYRAQQQAKRMENQEIPSIVVDGLPETPPTSTRDISSAGYDSPSPSGTPWQSTPPPHHRSSSAGLDFSLALDTSPGAGLQRSSRRISDISLLSTMDVTLKSRDSSPASDGVFSTMQNAMWGDMMLEAEEEEQKL
ncbi:calcium channel protein [Pleurotus ostreatus]|uniref:Calcium-channel protein CCH1 n=1 Tax=Pleurotus ostreatus TaxID=5322 RepID=A0A8H7DLK6_PLEOS|nr:calcium channel protein [Pleurotus ostreatus]KAF7416082.1 calcium channel protein [Pleurotus ostreatus]